MLLEGLHLTPRDLADGIKAATRRPCPEADAFLRVLEKAGGVSGPKKLLAKLKGGWRPTLDDLLDADLNELAMRWMPEGVLEVNIEGDPIRISTHNFSKVAHQLSRMSVKDRQHWLTEFVRLQSLIPLYVCNINIA